MNVVNTVLNASLIGAVGLILAWMGKSQSEAIQRAMDARFEAIHNRFDAVDQRFDGLDGRIDRLEERLDGRIDSLAERLDRRMDGMQTSVDALRSDLTRLATAVGVPPRASNA
jgi:hypothetical protein